MDRQDSTPRRETITRKTGAVLALIESGIRDYTLIARAVGLTEDDVKRIDTSTDDLVRSFAVRGLRRDVYHQLRTNVTCPGCGSVIYLVPCVACSMAKIRGRN